MKTLLVIPSVLRDDPGAAAGRGSRIQMDYHALAEGLRADGGQADLIGYKELEADTNPIVRATQKLAGKDVALAMMAYLRAGQYDSIFTNGENLAIPLALLLRTRGRRPGHVTIGHRPSAGKKRVFFQKLRVHDQIDSMLVYASAQFDISHEHLQIPKDRLEHIHFLADEHFFRPMPEIPVLDDQICAAGLEWRDYPTLISAMETMPEVTVKLAAASPWSKHRNETEKRVLPANVTARRYEYTELRELYASSSIVAVPLYETDFQAGVTSLLEAMAMAKPVIVTQTSGQNDIIVDGVNGLTVAPGDVEGWRTAVQRLRTDAELRLRLGTNARRWVLENATIERWVRNVIAAIESSADRSRSVGLSYARNDSPA